MPHRPTRRDLLLGGGAVASAAALGGCGSGFLSLQPTNATENLHTGPKGKESPDLARLVERGELPPVEERLPDDPVVVDPIDRIGNYGGTWMNVLLNASDDSWLYRTVGGERLLRWDPMWTDDTDPLPNVARSVEPNEDASVFTIHLRPGLRWSDGEPFTAGDVVFAFNDFYFNTVVSPVPLWYFTSRGEPATVEEVDRYTIRVSFAHPNAHFPLRLPQVMEVTDLPKHYLKQFHADYNPDAERLAKQRGFSSWGDLFNDRRDPWVNAEKPTIGPWIFTQTLGEGSQVITRRNPYFWQVDPEGSQLPYLDGVTYNVITEEQVILLKATNGEIDFSTRHINTLQNKPVLGHSRKRGSYEFVDLVKTFSNDMVIALNLTHKEPGKREVFRNKDFRIGLSHAINRQEMITAIWQRQGEPWQVAPARESRFYNEEFATQYLDYDPDLANEHLDRAGLDRRDEEGWRLRPDGKRLVFELEVASPAMIPFWPDGAESVCSYWQRVGVQARMKLEDRSLFYERKDNNKQDAAVWTGDGGLKGEALEPRWYFPYSSESIFGPLWRLYFESRGEDEAGEKPPPATLQQMQLYWELVETPAVEAREALMRQIMRIAQEQFYVIGTVRVPKTYGIVRNNFHNVPEGMPESALFNTPYPARPAQFFKS